MSAIILFLLAASSKPVCNAANQGRFWPQAANGSAQAVREFYQSGTLEMCSAGAWRFRWRPLSVHMSRLHKKTR